MLEVLYERKRILQVSANAKLVLGGWYCQRKTRFVYNIDTDKLTDRHKQTDRQTYRDRQTETDRQTDKQRDRPTDRDRQTGIQYDHMLEVAISPRN